MKYDCFCFLNGFDVLKLRLAELSDYVDYFVIVESTHTLSGKPKPLYWKENPITGYKVIHVVTEPRWAGEISDELAWNNMNGQIEDGFSEGLKNANPSDYLYIGDFDEIPRPSKLLTGDTEFPAVFLMDWYYYFVNYKQPKQWPGTCRDKMGDRKLFYPTYHGRYGIGNHNLIEDGGWHFSNFGGLQVVKEKLAAYPDGATLLSQLSDEQVLHDIVNGNDVYGELHTNRTHQSIPNLVALEKSLPKTILDNPKDYEGMILRPDDSGASRETPALTAPRTE
jgi:beta-1,4-mannosyl-glycoprotein beta-1,4-N-acetylglucosaminyltransferase